MGGLTFMTNYNYMTQYLYGSGKYDHIDFRLKNMAIYLSSDFLASIVKLPFETRKQLVQMANYDLEMKVITRNAWAASGALMARDLTFRSIILGTYFATTNIEHRPVVKYTVP